MHYLNQLNYKHIPYHTFTKMPEKSEADRIRSVSMSGCGLCCVCMTVELLTPMTLMIEDCVKISEECEANHGVGTDMEILGPVIANKYNIDFSMTDELGELVRHLQCGGVAIALVGVPEGKELGLFTKRTHFISLISTDGEDICILDPSYFARKFDIPERAGMLDASHAPYLYCPKATLDAETIPGRTKYYLFKRKR